MYCLVRYILHTFTRSCIICYISNLAIAFTKQVVLIRKVLDKYFKIVNEHFLSTVVGSLELKPEDKRLSSCDKFVIRLYFFPYQCGLLKLNMSKDHLEC